MPGQISYGFESLVKLGTRRHWFFFYANFFSRPPKKLKNLSPLSLSPPPIFFQKLSPPPFSPPPLFRHPLLHPQLFSPPHYFCKLSYDQSQNFYATPIFATPAHSKIFTPPPFSPPSNFSKKLPPPRFRHPPFSPKKGGWRKKKTQK